MRKERILTGDGTYTWYIPSLDEYYHSRFGAVTESEHIFIGAGLEWVIRGEKNIHILEVGSGTGLNIWLTCRKAQNTGVSVHYTALEPFPPGPEEVLFLDYAKDATPEEEEWFQRILNAPWDAESTIHPGFILFKVRQRLDEVLLKDSTFDLVYFDAFGPEVQPELWTGETFGKLRPAVKPGGVLVTYSAKGTVKRALKASGFEIELIPGPPGKRHITRAIKSR